MNIKSQIEKELTDNISKEIKLFEKWNKEHDATYEEDKADDDDYNFDFETDRPQFSREYRKFVTINEDHEVEFNEEEIESYCKGTTKQLKKNPMYILDECFFYNSTYDIYSKEYYDSDTEESVKANFKHLEDFPNSINAYKELVRCYNINPSEFMNCLWTHCNDRKLQEYFAA